MNVMSFVRRRLCLLDHFTTRTNRTFFTEPRRRASHWNFSWKSAATRLQSLGLGGAKAHLGGSYRCTSVSVSLCGCECTMKVKDVGAMRPYYEICDAYTFENNASRSRLGCNSTNFCGQDKVDHDLLGVKCNANANANGQVHLTLSLTESKVVHYYKVQNQRGTGTGNVFSSPTQIQHMSRTFHPLNTKYSAENLPRFIEIRAGNVSRCANSKIVNVRTFGTYYGRFAKDDHMNDRKSRVVEEESYAEEEMEEWIHPDDRSDLILDEDPELKSLMRELATDFGKEKLAGSMSEAVRGADDLENKTVEKREEETDTGTKVEGDVKMTTVETFEPISAEREEQPEKKFVFSINELISILREENAQDICVINIPKEKRYVDYFVVVTGRSPRHLKAMALYINQQYKSRKTKEDPFVLVEGEDTDDWICIDFGNIVLHIMSEETREFYELEKLWTLGPEYDEQLRRLKEYEIRMEETLDSVDLGRTNIEEGQEESGDGKPVISFAR